MDNNILNIVIKTLAGEASQEEKHRVDVWKKQFPEEFRKISSIYNSNLFDSKQFDMASVKKEIFEAINKNAPKEKHHPVFDIDRAWMKIAATIIILLSIGAGYILYSNISGEHLISNNTNELKTVTLPDGSTITLDKNSKLNYKTDWLNRFKRDVNLKGRAYFVITKDPSHPFRVNASDLTVTVLGTRFTVSEADKRVQIVLNEGKVKVSGDNSGKSYILSNNGEQLIISNGHFVKQNLINRNLYFSWLSDKLYFKNCSVGEAIEFLSDSYNLNINIEDKSILTKQLFGSAPSDNPYLIIKAIAYITNKKIIEKNGIINLK